VIATGEPVATPIAELTSVGADAPAARCSFCGKPRRNVAGLAVAAGWAICTECLALCHEIVTEELR
jgi:ClpX C4-type zinc finger